MFIPIGDDIQKRNFPAVGVFLIIVNVMVFMHTSKLWQESIPHDIDPRTFNYKDFDFTKPPRPPLLLPPRPRTDLSSAA